MTVATHPPARTHSRALVVLALLCFAGWALLTALLGAAWIVEGVRAVRPATSLVPVEDQRSVIFSGPWLTIKWFLAALWWLSLTLVPAALSLGLIDLALRNLPASRYLSVTLVALGAPAVTAFFLVGRDPLYGETSYVDATGPGVAVISIAVVGSAALWRLLR